jgi:maleylpyruvate isomerase
MRERSESLRWLEEGTALFASALAAQDDSRLALASALPGWTRKHLVAHLALNAQALSNLLTWARTGVETPMYASPEQREADIEQGGTRSGAELRQWYADSAEQLAADLARLTPEQWQARVRTRQGREIRAEAIPWMRAREVMVHAVDLGEQVRFSDLAEDFLGALVDDIVRLRSSDPAHPAIIVRAQNTGEAWSITGTGEPVRVMAPLPDLAAWLSGRATGRLKVIGAGELPVIPTWL